MNKKIFVLLLIGLSTTLGMEEDDLNNVNANRNQILEQNALNIFIEQALKDFPNAMIKNIYHNLLQFYTDGPLKKLIETVFDEKIETIGIEQSPFIVAICVGNRKLINDLFKVEKELNKLDMPIGRLKLTPLFVAVIMQDHELVDLLIQAGVDVNAKTSEGTSVLTVALNTTPKIITSLVNAGSDIDYRDKNDQTALDIGIYQNPEIVQHIIKNCSLNLNSANSERITPLMLAAHYGRAEIVKLLINKGFDVNTKDINGHTAVFFAIPHPKILKYLLTQKVDINSRDCENRTLLMYAAVMNAESTDALIKAGADINAADEEGKNCLMLALGDDGGYTKSIEPLLKAGINVNAVDNHNYSALLYAFLHHPNFMPILIQAGADPNISIIKKPEIRERFLSYCNIAKNYIEAHPRRPRPKK